MEILLDMFLQMEIQDRILITLLSLEQTRTQVLDMLMFHRELLELLRHHIPIHHPTTLINPIIVGDL